VKRRRSRMREVVVERTANQRMMLRLTTETVQGAALALQGVDDIQGGDGLALGVLSVGDSVTDDTLEEGLEDTTGLFVDHWKERMLASKGRVTTGDIWV
jgi:hypothetical protein